jgi:hypothetical protein
MALFLFFSTPSAKDGYRAAGNFLRVLKIFFCNKVNLVSGVVRPP